jgi:hypothetical protein
MLQNGQKIFSVNPGSIPPVCQRMTGGSVFNALPVRLVKLKTDKSRFKNELKRFLMYQSFYTLEEIFSNNSDVKS